MAKQTDVPDGNKKVKIRLPRLPGVPDEQQVLIVGHNFKNYRIKRGEDVLVPQEVADLIEQNMRTREENDRAEQALIKELAQSQI